jgi:peptidoglycan/LPS O-acetylase OafA/YrhL
LQNTYRNDLEGLRGLAILLVCLYHAGLLPGGYLGVDLFFVLSGYLISRLVWQEINAGQFSFARFMARRARRLVPALVLLCAFVLVIASAVLLPRSLMDFGKTLTGVSLFFSNLQFALSSTQYFGPGVEHQVLLHTWSLGVEMQFYLLFPLLLLLLRSSTFVTRSAMITGLAFASLVFFWWACRHMPTAYFYLPMSRMWELLGGAGLGLVQDRQVKWSQHAHMMSVSGLGITAGAVLFAAGQPAVAIPLACLGTFLLMAGNTLRHSPSRLLESVPLRFLGRISYALYLWHWPLLVFAGYLVWPGGSHADQNLLVILLALLPALFSTYVVEQPLRELPMQGRGGTWLPVSVSMLLVLAVGGSVLQLQQGLPSRFPTLQELALAPQLQQEAQNGDSSGFHAANCFGNFDTASFVTDCVLNEGGTQNAILWGDSHANHYAWGLFAVAQNSFNILEYAAPRCPPVLGYTVFNNPACQSFNDKLAVLLDQTGASVVIMAADWRSYIDRGYLEMEDVMQTIKALQQRGIRVLLIGQGPVFSFVYPDEYFYRVFAGNAADGLFMVPDTVGPALNETLAAAGADAFFDPMAMLCRESGCALRNRGRYLFRDQSHLTYYGSELVVTELQSTLALLR